MKRLLQKAILGMLGAIVALLLVLGCSGQYHARKALKRGISIVRTDTVVRIDTVWRIVEKVDTVFKYKFDTVTYYQDSILVKYFYSVNDSLVYIEVDCPDCPEVHTSKTITETVLVPEKPKGFFFRIWTWLKVNFWIGIIALIAIGGFSVLRRLKIL